IEVEVRCGKGTYVRSLARDAGAALGCGAYVDALRRTQVGPFRAEDGLPLGSDAESARRALLPSALALAELPRVAVSSEDVRRLRFGQAVRVEGSEEGEVALFDGKEAVGVGVVEGQTLRPAKMLA